MKATKEQREFLLNALTNQLIGYCLIPSELTIRQCWILLCKELNAISEQRPLGCGNSRNWKLAELDDSHIETVFRSITRN